MPKGKINRRVFIRLALLGGIGSGAVFIQRQTAGIGIVNFLRWYLRGELQRFKPATIVGLEQCSSYNESVKDKLKGLWRTAEMPEVRGKRILIKPNLLDQIEGNIATTSAQVIAAACDLLLEMGAGEIKVGDGSAFRRDTYSIVQGSGLAQVLEERNIPFIDLNYDELAPVKVRDGWIRQADHLWLPKYVREADYIVSIPKLKTHHWAGVTLSLKNLLGVIPGSRYGWPKNIIHMNGINATILGLYQTLPPVLSIIDGIIGMEGNGPLLGKAVQHGLLAMGKDPLAVDIICSQLMGFPFETIPHLSGAAWAGIGQSKRIETRGVPFEKLKRTYQAPPSI